MPHVSRMIVTFRACFSQAATSRSADPCGVQAAHVRAAIRMSFFTGATQCWNNTSSPIMPRDEDGPPARRPRGLVDLIKCTPGADEGARRLLHGAEEPGGR